MILRFCAACGAVLGAAPPCTCAACGHRFWDNPKPCGGAFVAHEGRLLLVQRQHEPWAGHWDVPGGFSDGAEHPEETTRRELREETGLDVRITGLVGMWIDSYDATVDATLNIYFHAVADRPEEVRALDETAAVRWFTAAELDDVPLAFPGHIPEAVDLWRASPAASP